MAHVYGKANKVKGNKSKMMGKSSALTKGKGKKLGLKKVSKGYKPMKGYSSKKK